MNLKRSLYTMVGLGLVGTSLLAAISLWGDAQQERALADMQEKASWLRLQLTSDMMHDAMRGDVLEALRIAKNPLATAAEKDALLADADEHASNFISNMNELQQAKLPDAVKQKSDEVALALIQYRNSTNDIIATALKQPTRAEALWPAFMQQFRQLETSMAEFSDVLEQSIKSSQTQVVKDNQRLTGIFYTTVALIIFVLLICAQIIIRRVFKTLGGEPEVASRIVRQISQGEFNVQIPEVPSQSLLDQMRQMTTSLASFVQAQQHLAQQHVAGVRSARLDCAGLSGGFAHMAEQVNLLIEGKERLLDEVLAHIRCYVQGDFTQPMRALPQELMAVTQAVNSTRQGLADAAKNAIENARIRVALDSVATNVLVVAPNQQIIYCNQAFMAMLTTHAARLQSELRQLNPQQPIGQSLSVFQAQSKPQLAIFNDLTHAHQSNYSIAGLHFALSSNPVRSTTGEHLGLVIEFEDRTPMVQIENEIAQVLAAAAKGDFSQQISLTAKDGFFLNLSNSINQLQAGVTQSLTELAAALTALAKGDLTRNMQGQFEGAFAQIQTSCNGTITSLTRLLRIIADAALQIRSSSNEIAVGNQNLSQRTEEQATSLEETASAMDELTSAVKHNNDHAQQASQLAQHASEMAQQGGLVVNSVVTTMRDIQHSSHKIVEIISVIDGIAFQTNILALNAAVEAARAGEQGRGFAVVAAEVRSLAQRSAAAAKEIAALIEVSVNKVESGTRQADDAGHTMTNIIQSVSQVTEIIIGISSASHEQTTGIQQVSKTIAQMDNMTQQNAALVEQAAAASEHLREQAETMAQIVGQFVLEDD